ncbi:MAG: glutathione synthase [Planctomycetes bacterium]|nr:glutathione synthase [Planctomycetota bacterium]
MKIGIVFNNYNAINPDFSIVKVIKAAVRRGHNVCLINISDFNYRYDGTIYAYAKSVPYHNYKTSKQLIEIFFEKNRSTTINLEELDIMLLRNNPAQEHSVWAQSAGIVFGRFIASKGVMVLNDPDGLAKVTNKLYLEYFPEEIRPKSVISRDTNVIKDFIKENDGRAVLKPLHGSGGKGIFLVTKKEKSNVNQIVESLLRDGYVIAQEFIPEVENGDIRVVFINGEPFKYRGKYCAYKRIPKGEDIRCNIHSGGGTAPFTLTKEILKISEKLKPKLINDGIFMAGVDFIGNRVTEINVFSPGGIKNSQKYQNVDFAKGIVEVLENKLDYKNHYGYSLNNNQIATL